MKDKLSRQEKIARIIKEHKISNQAVLLKYLLKEGIKITQATLSRDLKEMGIILTLDGHYYHLPSVITAPVTSAQLHRHFGSYVTDIKYSGNLIVVKTLPGEASGAARLVDGLTLNEVLGTIAGDDTFLIVSKNKQSVPKIMSFLTLTG
ncbi:MAG: arginine repressor [Planctomycetota bacterium]|nr:arginine repressor [Planctomycetota bacterium]MDI6787702.1 arginine repressor [Planctomycetota bacterium]